MAIHRLGIEFRGKTRPFKVGGINMRISDIPSYFNGGEKFIQQIKLAREGVSSNQQELKGDIIQTKNKLSKSIILLDEAISASLKISDKQSTGTADHEIAASIILAEVANGVLKQHPDIVDAKNILIGSYDAMTELLTLMSKMGVPTDHMASKALPLVADMYAQNPRFEIKDMLKIPIMMSRYGIASCFFLTKTLPHLLAFDCESGSTEWYAGKTLAKAADAFEDVLAIFQQLSVNSNDNNMIALRGHLSMYFDIVTKTAFHMGGPASATGLIEKATSHFVCDFSKEPQMTDNMEYYIKKIKWHIQNVSNRDLNGTNAPSRVLDQAMNNILGGQGGLILTKEYYGGDCIRSSFYYDGVYIGADGKKTDLFSNIEYSAWEYDPCKIIYNEFAGDRIFFLQFVQAFFPQFPEAAAVFIMDKNGSPVKVASFKSFDLRSATSLLLAALKDRLKDACA